MSRDRRHLVPEVVIDAARAMMDESTNARQVVHVDRIRAIREFCEEALRQYENSRNDRKRRT